MSFETQPGHCPGGTGDNSPAFQRRDKFRIAQVPQGRLRLMPTNIDRRIQCHVSGATLIIPPERPFPTMLLRAYYVLKRTYEMPDFSRPCGTRNVFSPNSALKRRAIFTMSLRDKALAESVPP